MRMGLVLKNDGSVFTLLFKGNITKKAFFSPNKQNRSLQVRSFPYPMFCVLKSTAQRLQAEGALVSGKETGDVQHSLPETVRTNN